MPIGPHSSIIATALLIGGVPLSVQAPVWLDMSANDMLVTSVAVGGVSLTNPVVVASSGISARTVLTPPASPKPPGLMISYSPGKSRARIELGALGGGRIDAPGLVHLDLGMHF